MDWISMWCYIDKVWWKQLIVIKTWSMYLSVHSQIRQPPDHDDCPKSEDQLYPGSSGGVGGLLPIGGGGRLRKQPCHV